MNIILIQYYKSPIGELIIGSLNEELCLCDWRYRKMRQTVDTRLQNILEASYESGSSEINEKTISQLNEYFAGERKQFDLPLKFAGSPFQVKVWNQLLQVPYGETRSYMQLSEILGDKKAIRAVATANGANAISIIVPCHRIVGSNGKLVGYAGGLPAKKQLLDIESPNLFSLFQ